MFSACMCVFLVSVGCLHVSLAGFLSDSAIVNILQCGAGDSVRSQR